VDEINYTLNKFATDYDLLDVFYNTSPYWSISYITRGINKYMIFIDMIGLGTALETYYIGEDPKKLKISEHLMYILQTTPVIQSNSGSTYSIDLSEFNILFDGNAPDNIEISSINRITYIHLLELITRKIKDFVLQNPNLELNYNNKRLNWMISSVILSDDVYKVNIIPNDT
jgi:hypothetical protein